MHAQRGQLEAMEPLLFRLFKSLDLMVKMRKSLLQLIRRIPWVPSQFKQNDNNSVTREGQVRKVQQEAMKLIKSTTMSARELAKFIGKAVATSKAVIQAPLHYRALQRALNLVIPEDSYCSEKYNSQITQTSEMITDLNWWAMLDRGSSNMSLTTCDDHSSDQGWEARCGDTNTGGSWSIEAVKHIDFLELTAAFLVLKTFVTNQTDVILLKMDNISAVNYINQSNCAT